jgi:hypothetical protein
MVLPLVVEKAERESNTKRRHRWLVTGLSLLPAMVFLWLATVRLDAQGLYYDELHQAAGAFTYLGSLPEYFALFTVRGIPLLNMHYSGAIKTAVYGLYLRFVRPEFSVLSWRLVGIFFVGVGLVAFVLLTHSSLSLVPLVVMLGLLLTDTTVLLGVRHDWGPVALALALRLVLIGMWLRGEGAGQPSIRNSFALGGLVGFAIFEKLSSWVMILALGWILLSSGRRTVQHLLAVVGGVFVGALPLVVVNLSSFLAQGKLISLTDMSTAPDRSWLAFLQYAWEYVGLGAGEQVRQFILGSSAPLIVRTLEPWLVMGAVMLAGWVAVFSRFREPTARLALMAIGCYVSVGIALYLFPRRTWIHHWVLGTPFQYVAVGLGLESLKRVRTNTPGFLLWTVVSVLLAVRLAGEVSLERALWRGEAALSWHPSLTQLGRFAANRADQAIFIAADWGVAMQIYCLANGRPGLVHQTFWSYHGPEDLLRLQQQSGTDVLYAVSLNPPSNVMPETTQQIFRDLERSPQWRETEVDIEASNLAAVTVRKFLYDSPPDGAVRTSEPGS